MFCQEKEIYFVTLGKNLLFSTYKYATAQQK